jgi:D-3-phosphoglycerate dehydrogenase / 2-oxoglutarate reductase
MKSYRILLYEDMHDVGKRVLSEQAELVIADSLEESHLVEKVKDVDAIIVRANGTISARIMDAAPRLKVIGRHGVGLDAIDLQAAQERGIVVCNTPTANVESVAEQAVGLMLAVAKQICRADKSLRQGRWEVRYEFIGQEIAGRTLGLIGMGRIGARVAEICHLGFSMPVIYTDLISYPDVEEKFNASKYPLDEVLIAADIISLHVPLTPETHNMISAEQLAKMKPSSILINTARGLIVDERALVESLRNRRLAGAGLDVYCEEPAEVDNPLFHLDNVVVTPHMAAHTEDALRQMSMVAQDVINVLTGKKAVFRVV